MNSSLSRRILMQSLLASPLLGSATAMGQTKRDLIDVHCHIFNASDLPAEAFLKIVFLGLYPRQDEQQHLNLKDQDVVDHLIKLFLFILGADGAPTARDEIDVLTRRKKPNIHWADPAVLDADTISAIRGFLKSQQSRANPNAREKGAIAVANAIREAANFGTAAPAATSDVAKRAYFSITDIGRYLRWFTLFKQYRYVHIQSLIKFHDDQGFNLQAIAPALIDYSKWLGQSVISSLEDQVEVIGLLRDRFPGVKVKPYVGFDPLREIYFRHHQESKSPLQLAVDAARNHGFVGVKVYPPMGFKPSGNTDDQPYPPRVLEEISGGIGAQLNDVLNDLYKNCIAHGLRILAHAADSNGAGMDFADRADPTFWIPVFEKYPALSVCLGHFGAFSYRANGTPKSMPFPEASWEWALGGYILQHPSAPIYSDLSYFSEILDADADTRKGYAGNFKAYEAKFDPGLKHIMFGTDWVMTGLEKGYPKYTTEVAQFLAEDCGFGSIVVEGILSKNARQFLGI